MGRCIIHIGMHKTGSTSIQHSLQGFGNDRFLYAGLDQHPNHSLAIFSLFSPRPEMHHLHRAHGLDTVQVREYIRMRRADLARSIDAAGSRTLIISGEDISILPKNSLQRMKEFFQENVGEVTVVGYVRSPVGFMTSAFQERVKGGGLNSLDLEKTYRKYRQTFEAFDEVFGRENVQLWKFDPKVFPGGCVVQDFSARVGLSLPASQIRRVNETLSRQAVSMLYTFRKYGQDLSGSFMNGSEAMRIAGLLNGLRQDRLRFSPELVRPVLERNRADIEWMEERLGQTLSEDLGERQPGDICNEGDLLRPDPDVVSRLLSLVADPVRLQIKGDASEDVALMVHLLRNKGESALNPSELIEQLRHNDPNVLEGIPEDKAGAIIRGVFNHMKDTLAGLQEGAVIYVGLGQFKVKIMEQEVKGKKITRTRILFRREEAKKA